MKMHFTTLRAYDLTAPCYVACSNNYLYNPETHGESDVVSLVEKKNNYI